MQNFQGLTAFVTGAASGIGLSLARALLAEGANVMLADIETEALKHAVASLEAADRAAACGQVDSLICDVANADAVGDAAQRTIARFGNVHVLCNNAGVGTGGPLEEVTTESWQWIIGVNLMGVVHGLQAFIPHMKKHGEEAHIVNTASVAGMLCLPHMGPYCATKFAVVAMTETLAAELAGSNIGVSVLCPMWVRTRIHESDRNRPASLRGTRPVNVDPARRSEIAQVIADGLDPDAVAATVLSGIRSRRLHIFTHRENEAILSERFDSILAAFAGMPK
ncbi:MAG: SDR family NAD(P)-dependent oxidoreductase [Proteobacteria bacterium]|nr:SDR family NAD(P)-dependent oxidoreductase [Pseudomonadota bacterium]